MYDDYLHYAIRENRDAKARDLKAAGYTVKKRSSRNQVLSPSYVEDWAETGRTASPNGFGGCDSTFFSALYTVEWSR